MPTVPTIAGPRAEVAPLPRVQSPLEAFGGGAAVETMDYTPVARVALAIHQEETAKADQIAVTEASGKFAALETRLKLATAQRKGKNAFTLPEEVEKEFTDGANEILQDAKTDAQKMRFQALRTQSWAELDYGVQSHVAQERAAYDTDVTTSSLESLYQATAAAWDNPRRTEQGIGDQVAVLTEFARRQGWDAETLKTKKAKIVSENRIVVVDRMLAAKQAPSARAYYDEHKDEIQDPKGQVFDRIKGANTDQMGESIAGRIWSTMGPKDAKDPINIFDMDKAVREDPSLKDNPEGKKAAMDNLRVLTNAWSAQVKEQRAVQVSTIYEAINNGASLSAVTGLPSYQALDGDEKYKIRQEIVNKQYSEASRDYTLTNRRDQVAAHTGLAKYLEYNTVQWLREHTPAEIAALQGTIGRAFTLDLAQRREQVVGSDATAKEAQIQEDTFKLLASQAGFKAFATPSTISTGDAEALVSLRIAVEQALNASRKGRETISQPEQQEIMQKVINQKVITERSWRSDIEQMPFQVTPDQQARTRVPLESIDSQHPTFVQDAVQMIIRSGAARGVGEVSAPQTPDYIRQKFRKQIERAFYVFAYTKPTPTAEQLKAILTGNP